MEKQDKRIMLAGNALSGLLASQPENKGWNIDALSVVSLKIADTVLEMSELDELPALKVTPEATPESDAPSDEKLQS